MRILIIILSLFVVSGCTKYYLCQSDGPLIVYADKESEEALVRISPGKRFLTTRQGKMWEVTYGSYNGYIVPQVFPVSFRYSKSKFGNLYFGPDSTYSYAGSSYSSPSRSSSSSGGPVQVKGYYRKDGTYVRPHTRKAPTRRN